jgi:thiol-disulfide isomerase/thioredoxin
MMYHLNSDSCVKTPAGHMCKWLSDKHTILFVHAKWCGYCKRTMPEFVAASKTVTSIHFALLEDVDLKKMSDPLPVSGFPTFFLINKDTGIITVVPNFPRDTEGMIKFLSKL